MNRTDISKIRRVAVIVNANAGTVLQIGADKFKSDIEAACAAVGWVVEVSLVPGKQLGARLDEKLAADFDLVLISGGDGTVSKMLPALMQAQTRVGVLPLGTLNLLGADLGLTTDVADNIRKLAEGQTATIDVCALNGMPFHSISGVGYSAMMARERERARRSIPFSKALSFGWAAMRTLLFAKPISVDLVVDGEHRIREADGVLVTNNHFDGIPWRRGSLQDGVLEVHTFKAEGIRGRIKALMAVARGNWRSLSTLESTTATEVTLRRRGRRRVMVATDGEIQMFRGDLHYTITPKSLELMVAPANRDGIEHAETA